MSEERAHWVATLAGIAGISPPPEDLDPLEQALADYADYLKPLFAASLPADVLPQPFDPRWDV